MTSESFGDRNRKPHGPGNLFKANSSMRTMTALRFTLKRSGGLVLDSIGSNKKAKDRKRAAKVDF